MPRPPSPAKSRPPLLFVHDDASKEEQQSRAVFEGLQQGKINRSLFTDNANSYFTEQALQDFASGGISSLWRARAGV
jgi:hypothetical protein